jgi:hypothetical protein
MPDQKTATVKKLLLEVLEAGRTRWGAVGAALTNRRRGRRLLAGTEQ